MGRGFGGMMYPGAIERRVNRVLGIVDASTEQKQKVRAIFEKAANDLYAARDQRQQNRRAMAEALAAATIDRAKVEQLRGDRMKIADATSKRLTDALVEAAEVLTPAQRADLVARFQRRGG
jgi:periplasmic protein CpxP/Spy